MTICKLITADNDTTHDLLRDYKIFILMKY